MRFCVIFPVALVDLAVLTRAPFRSRFEPIGTDPLSIPETVIPLRLPRGSRPSYRIQRPWMENYGA
jgi:hypothetical protein